MNKTLRVISVLCLVSTGVVLLMEIGVPIDREEDLPRSMVTERTPGVNEQDAGGQEDVHTGAELLVPPLDGASVQAESSLRDGRVAEEPLAVSEAAKQVSLPLPLRTTIVTPPTETNRRALEALDIVALSNVERMRAGLPLLLWNQRLVAVAEAKAVDMIEKQYFDHVSPDGTDIGILMDRYRYDYLRVGENLAMGDFASSSHVVDGWMNSPGHRANIMNAAFTEIGVAAIRGAYEGREVWYAVQEFGRPMPACAKPDEVLRVEVDRIQLQIDDIAERIATERSVLESPTISVSEYNARVDGYNEMVKLYNELIARTKIMVETFNESVRQYNACIEAG